MSHAFAPSVARRPAPLRPNLIRGIARFLSGDLHWRLISTAPYNRNVELRLVSQRGASSLPFPCRQTNRGWINCDLGTRVLVEPTHWRVWPEE